MSIKVEFGGHRSIGSRRNKALWEHWMRSTAKLAARYVKAEGEDPFWYSENSTRSLLCAGAFEAGWTSLSEFGTTKRSSPGAGDEVHGRCDLWVNCPAEELSWAIEFKQTWPRGPAAARHIPERWAAAKQDACVSCNAGNELVAGLVISLSTHRKRDAGELVVMQAIEEVRPGFWAKLFSRDENFATTFIWLETVRER